MSQEVGSRGQFSSARGAGRWQRYSIHAMAGACRAERAKWGLDARGGRLYVGLEPERKMEIPGKLNKIR